MRQSGAAESSNSQESRSDAYCVFRVKKRDVHAVSLVAAIWFLWSQGGEIAGLFKSLFDALA